MSVEKASKVYDGKSSCKDCPFYPRLCTEKIMNWCNERTQKAFKAGAKWQKDKEK